VEEKDFLLLEQEQKLFQLTHLIEHLKEKDAKPKVNEDYQALLGDFAIVRAESKEWKQKYEQLLFDSREAENDLKEQIYRATEDYETKLEEHTVERDRFNQHTFQCKNDMAQLLNYRSELEILLEQSTHAIE
jgi:uncharacterized membrane-anchored protein YjiN (DUF445 family)